MKWLKNRAEKSLYFMQLFLHYILFSEKFIGQVKAPLYSVFLNLSLEKQNRNQNVKIKKIVLLDHCHQKFRLF